MAELQCSMIVQMNIGCTGDMIRGKHDRMEHSERKKKNAVVSSSTEGNFEYDSLTGKGLVHNIDNLPVIEFNSLQDLILYDNVSSKSGCICHGAFDESKTPFLGFSDSSHQESVVCAEIFRRFQVSTFNPTVVLKRLSIGTLDDTKSINVKSLKNGNVKLPCLRCSELKSGHERNWKSTNYNTPRLNEMKGDYSCCHSNSGIAVRNDPVKRFGPMRTLNGVNTPRCIVPGKSKKTPTSSQISTQIAILQRIASDEAELGNRVRISNCDDYSNGHQNDVKLEKCHQNANKILNFFCEYDPIDKRYLYTDIKKEPNEINSEAAGSDIYQMQWPYGNMDCISDDSLLMSSQNLPQIPYLLKCHQNPAHKCNDLSACANANKKFALYFILTVDRGRQLPKEVMESGHLKDGSVSRMNAFIAASAVETRPTNILVPAGEDVVKKIISNSQYRILPGKVEGTGAIEKAKCFGWSAINVCVVHDDKPVLTENVIAGGKRKSSGCDNDKNASASRKRSALNENDYEDEVPRQKFHVNNGFCSFLPSALSDREGCDTTDCKMNDLVLSVTSDNRARDSILKNNDLQKPLGVETDNLKPNPLHYVHQQACFTGTCSRLMLGFGDFKSASPAEYIQPGTNPARKKDVNDPSLENSVVEHLLSPSPAASQVGHTAANHQPMFNPYVVIQTADPARSGFAKLTDVIQQAEIEQVNSTGSSNPNQIVVSHKCLWTLGLTTANINKSTDTPSNKNRYVVREVGYSREENSFEQGFGVEDEPCDEATSPIPKWGVICTSLPELGFVRVHKLVKKLTLYDPAVVSEPCRFENIQELKRFLNSRLADLSFPYKSKVALDWIVVTAGFLRVKTVPPTNPQFWKNPRTSKRTLRDMQKGSKKSNAPRMRKGHIVPAFLPRDPTPPLLKPSRTKKPAVKGCSGQESKRNLPSTICGKRLPMNAENLAQFQQWNKSPPSAFIELPRRGHVSIRSSGATVSTPFANPPTSGTSSGIQSAKALTPKSQALKLPTSVKFDLAPSSLATVPVTSVLRNSFPLLANFKQNLLSSSLTCTKSVSVPSVSAQGQPQAILTAESYASAAVLHGSVRPASTYCQSVTTMSASTSLPTVTATVSHSKSCTVFIQD